MNEIVFNKLQTVDKKIENNYSNLSIILNENVNKIVELITNKYNLIHEKEDISNLIIENLNNLNIKIKKKKNQINQDERCKGRKIDGTQCSRRCKVGKDFCGSHLKNLTYGSVDDGIVYTIKEKGKRGRKKKNENNINSDFIETWIDKDLGKDYLIDKNNLIYRNNLEYPELIGVKVNKTIHYINEVPKVFFE